MIVPSLEAQKRAREELRRLDQAITADKDIHQKILEHARDFREALFGAFEFIERESMSLDEIFIRMQRIDENRLQIQNGKHQPFLLILNVELAYHSRPLSPDQEQSAESKPRWLVELAARMFAVIEPPAQGLLRYYTIYGDGSWRRTVFTLGANGVQPQSAMAPNSSADVLVLEAIDLLTKVCTLHPTWSDLTPHAETLTADKLQDRTFVKTHLTGLGSP